MKSNIYQSGEYLQNNPEWGIGDATWKAAHIMDMLRRHNLEPRVIGDVGCGAGEILYQLRLRMPEECTFYGFDISPQAIELTRSRETDRLTFQLKHLSEIEADRFDLVLAIDVFEHVEDFFGFLRTLKTRGAYKLFHIPLDLSAKSVTRNELMKKRKTVGHLHYFSRHTALAALQETGHEVIDFFYTCTMDLPRKSIKSVVFKYINKSLFKLSKESAVRLLGGYSLMVLTK
jgi:cyclopropane fatty-acyl-phospholipid synthase-like methyltransferase